jgi:hypothetical protein
LAFPYKIQRKSGKIGRKLGRIPPEIRKKTAKVAEKLTKTNRVDAGGAAGAQNHNHNTEALFEGGVFLKYRRINGELTGKLTGNLGK